LRSWLLPGLVLGLTFLAYSGTLTFDFVHDDRGQILENPAVHSWDHVPQYFTEHVWAGAHPDEVGNYYRPVFLLWLRANYALFGERAWLWHLTTILIHLVATFLVFRLALRVLDDEFAAAVAGLVFGVHPVHIESVAWISGVTDPLLAALFLLAFHCHLKWREEAGRKWLVLAVVFQAGALLAKETALIFPLLVGAWEWVEGGRQEGGARTTGAIRAAALALRTTAPYWVLVPPYLAARTLALDGFRHLIADIPIATVLYTWPSLVWFWVRHLVWPAGLSFFYDFPAIQQPTWSNFVVPAIAVAAFSALLAWWTARSKQVVFAVAWLVLPLLPLLDIRVLPVDDFAHDRYLYLPSVGLAVLAGLAVQRIPEGRARTMGYPAARALPVMMLGIAMSASTAYQSLYFADDVVFFQQSVARAPHNMYAKANLAARMLERGRYEVALQLLEEVHSAHPGFWLAAYNLAYTYYRLGRFQDAQRQFLKAIQIHPRDPDQYLFLGLSHFRLGRLDEAVRAIRHAVALRDDGYGHHFALGMVLKLKGDLAGARSEFEREVERHPQNVEAVTQLNELNQKLKRAPADVAPAE
jgi:tetratricopeptide (TPR) repeat protein